jgi:hypothetical protein
MKLEIDIEDEKVEHLSPPAESRLKTVVSKYSNDILDEASRIETTRNNGHSPEITATIIDDAVDFNKRFRTRKTNSTSKIIALIIAFISTVLTGGLFKTEKFNEPKYLIPFLVVFLISIIANIYIFLNDNNNE